MEVPAKGGACGPKVATRYIVAIMMSIGMGIIYGLKVGLHVVIVTMINNTAIALENPISHKVTVTECHFDTSVTNASHVAEPNPDGPFAWSKEIQGYILSSYFFGYLVAELPGGRVAEATSAKWTMFFAVAINVICVLLSPLMANLHYGALIVMRVLQGIGGGVTFPACHVLLAHWAPPAERSVMSSITYAGTALGTVIFMLLSGLIAGSISWQAVFYIEGAMASLWLIMWVLLVSDSPRKQKWISQAERDKIVGLLDAENGGGKKKANAMPWKKAMSSLPFLAILVAHTCNNWGWYMVLIELPQYLSSVLQFNIKENAVWTSVPFFIMWIFSLLLSKILDCLRARGKLSTTWARKVSTLICSVIPMICFIVLCIVKCNRPLAVALMTIAVTATGGMFSGFLSNHIDIAPNHAGLLVAVTNTVATVPGIVVPIAVGALTADNPGMESWRIIFVITIILYVIEIAFYTIFASGKVQKWNSADEDELSEEASQPLKGNK